MMINSKGQVVAGFLDLVTKAYDEKLCKVFRLSEEEYVLITEKMTMTDLDDFLMPFMEPEGTQLPISDYKKCLTALNKYTDVKRIDRRRREK